MKRDSKQDLNVLYQDLVFWADGKNKMAALASDWLRPFLTSPLKPLNGIQWNLTGSKISTSSTKFVFFGRFEKQYGRRGLWLAETFSTSRLKPLNGIQWNLTRSKISMSSTKFVFLGPMVEDVEILLPIKFGLIPFSGFRGEVQNVSANQRPRGPSCLFDRPEKHKLGRGFWDLASYQVSFNSVQQFKRRSRKCRNTNTNLVDDIKILLPIKFGWIPFSGFREEVENVSTNQRPGRPSCFSETQTW